MTDTLISLLGEALIKAVADERAIAERLACMILEKDHKDIRRAGTFQFQAQQMETQLLAQQRTVEALKLSLARVRAAQPQENDHDHI